MTLPTRVLSGLSQQLLRSAKVKFFRFPFFIWILRRFLNTTIVGKKRRPPLPGVWKIPDDSKTSCSEAESKPKTRGTQIPSFQHSTSTSSTQSVSSNTPNKERTLSQSTLRSFFCQEQNATQASTAISLVTVSKFSTGETSISGAQKKEEKTAQKSTRGQKFNLPAKENHSIEVASRKKPRNVAKLRIQICKENPEAPAGVSTLSIVAQNPRDSESKFPQNHMYIWTSTIVKDFLKRTGSGNLFQASAEVCDPDIEAPSQGGHKKRPRKLQTEERDISPSTSKQGKKMASGLIFTSPIKGYTTACSTDCAKPFIMSSSKKLALEAFNTLVPSYTTGATKITNKDDLELDSLIPGRHCKHGQSRSENQRLKMDPLRDSPEVLRKASSSTRRQPPIPQNSTDELEARGRRRRKTTNKRSRHRSNLGARNRRTYTSNDTDQIILPVIGISCVPT